MKRDHDVTTIAPGADAVEALNILGKTGFPSTPRWSTSTAMFLGFVTREGVIDCLCSPPRTAGEEARCDVREASRSAGTCRARYRRQQPSTAPCADSPSGSKAAGGAKIAGASRRSAPACSTALPIFALGAASSGRAGGPATGLERRPHPRAFRDGRRGDVATQYRHQRGANAGALILGLGIGLRQRLS